MIRTLVDLINRAALITIFSDFINHHFLLTYEASLSSPQEEESQRSHYNLNKKMKTIISFKPLSFKEWLH